MYLEEGFSDETVADLKKRGYEVESSPARPRPYPCEPELEQTDAEQRLHHVSQIA